MADSWFNPDGLAVHGYVDHDATYNHVRTPASKGGMIKEAVIDYDLALLVANGGNSFTTDRTNSGAATGFSGGDVRLPALSSILRCTVVATESAAGGTSLKIGVYNEDGTAIDDDGIGTATELVTANLAAGKRVFGNGALVAATAGTAGLATEAFIGITSTGTFTAGRGRIVIEYIDPMGV